MASDRCSIVWLPLYMLYILTGSFPFLYLHHTLPAEPASMACSGRKSLKEFIRKKVKTRFKSGFCSKTTINALTPDKNGLINAYNNGNSNNKQKS